MRGRLSLQAVTGTRIRVRNLDGTAALLYASPVATTPISNIVTMTGGAPGAIVSTVVYCAGEFIIDNADDNSIVYDRRKRVTPETVIDLSGPYFGMRNGIYISDALNEALGASERGEGMVYVPNWDNAILDKSLETGTRTRFGGAGRYDLFFKRSSEFYGPAMFSRPTFGEIKSKQRSPFGILEGFMFDFNNVGQTTGNGTVTAGTPFITNLPTSFVTAAKVGYALHGFGLPEFASVLSKPTSTSIEIGVGGVQALAVRNNFGVNPKQVISMREQYRMVATAVAGSPDLTVATNANIRPNMRLYGELIAGQTTTNPITNEYWLVKSVTGSSTKITLDRPAAASGQFTLVVRREDDGILVTEEDQYLGGDYSALLLRGPLMRNFAMDGINGTCVCVRGGRNLTEADDFKLTYSFRGFDTTGASDSTCRNGGIGMMKEWCYHASAQATVDLGFMEIYRTEYTDRCADVHIQGCSSAAIYNIQGFNGIVQINGKSGSTAQLGSMARLENIAFVHQDGSCLEDGTLPAWIKAKNTVAVNVINCVFQPDMTAANTAPSYVGFSENADATIHITGSSLVMDYVPGTDSKDYRPYRTAVGNNARVTYRLQNARTFETVIGGIERYNDRQQADGGMTVGKSLGFTGWADITVTNGGTATALTDAGIISLASAGGVIATWAQSMPPVANIYDGRSVTFTTPTGITSCTFNKTGTTQRFYPGDVASKVLSMPADSSVQFVWRALAPDAATYPTKPGAWVLVGKMGAT